MDARIQYIHRTESSPRKVIALFDNGTWEELFSFKYEDTNLGNGKLYHGKTKEEAMAIYRNLKLLKG